MKYYKGRNNLSCTIFVPIKCENNCPFCNTNVMYDKFEYKEDYLNKIFESIDIINKNDSISEFVITGGEPFMNLDITKRIIDKCDKAVFINTSLPKVNNIDEIIDFVNKEDKIGGINISRHLNFIHQKSTEDIDVMNKISKYVRVNTIIYPSYNFNKIKNFIDYYATDYRLINLRADYRNITPENLKSRDKIDEMLLNEYKFEYSTSCLVCNTEVFSDEDYKIIQYHRGLEHSSVTYGDRTYINDIIINIYGHIYKDWDMIEDKKFLETLYNETLN